MRFLSFFISNHYSNQVMDYYDLVQPIIYLLIFPNPFLKYFYSNCTCLKNQIIIENKDKDGSQ